MNENDISAFVHDSLQNSNLEIVFLKNFEGIAAPLSPGFQSCCFGIQSHILIICIWHLKKHTTQCIFILEATLVSEFRNFILLEHFFFKSLVLCIHWWTFSTRKYSYFLFSLSGSPVILCVGLISSDYLLYYFPSLSHCSL